MKKYRGEKESTRLLRESEELTPLPLAGGDSSEPNRRKKDPFVVLGFAIVALLALLFVLYLACGYFLEGMEKEESEPQPKAEQTEQSEWLGAFADREISEKSLEVSVRIRHGAAGEYGARSASGVIVDSNGWIASNNAFFDSGQKGRVYVLLNDGREYAVEKIVRDGELAFLKIDADGLSAAEIEEDINVCLGQRVLAVASGEAPSFNSILLSGIVSQTGEDRIRTDIDIIPSAAGCPVFDEQGRMLGISVEGDGSIFSAKKMQEKLRDIKEK